MIKIQDYIKCYRNMIGKELCKEIIESSDNILEQPAYLGYANADDFKKSTVNDGDLTQYRNCYEASLNKKFDGAMYEIVGKVLQKYQEDFSYFYTGLSTEDTGYQHLLYKGSEKGEYKSHIDHMDLYPRVLSCSIILNDNYDGGDFSFFEGEHTVKKQAGSVVIFPSNFCFPHAITPVTNGDRHSIITWIH